MLATFFDKELAMGEEVVMVSHRVMMKFYCCYLVEINYMVLETFDSHIQIIS